MYRYLFYYLLKLTSVKIVDLTHMSLSIIINFDKSFVVTKTKDMFITSIIIKITQEFMEVNFNNKSRRY